MALKGLDYEIDPITPFFGDDEFARLSPLRRIPVLVHDDLVLTDSTVICAWLDEAFPGPRCSPPRPPTAPARAGSRNMPTRGSATSSSGACSTRSASIPSSGASPAIRRGSRRRWPRTCRPRSIISKGELPAAGFLFGEIGLADIAIASFFRNAAYAGFAIGRRPLAAHRRASSSAPSPMPASPPSSLRAGPAFDQPGRPPPGPARRRRAARRRYGRHARAEEGHHDALTAARESLAKSPSGRYVHCMFEIRDVSLA